VADTAGHDVGSGFFTSEGTGALYQPVGDHGGHEPPPDADAAESYFYQSMPKLPYVKPLGMLLRECGQVEPPTPPDTIPPVVDNYDPPQLSRIAPTDAVAFDVTDNLNEFHAIMITVFYPGTSSGTGKSTWEIIHTGDAFAPRFGYGSSRVPITNGYRYTVRRLGGWLSDTFQIFPFVVDGDGNQNV
jgi:hypothetical protein